jgi:phosphoglycolate phosphatase-like HAD superfamily hydrolase
LEVERKDRGGHTRSQGRQNLRIKPFKVIVLDFDGVIVESNDIKHRAFSHIFSEFPSHHREIMAYHHAHNAVNRHDKFRYIMEHILKQEFDSALANDWAARFSSMTRDEISACPYVAGAFEFIRFFSGNCPLYVASATPLDELNLILQNRGLHPYFKGVLGAPTPKKAMFDHIMNAEKILPEDILYIGDSKED